MKGKQMILPAQMIRRRCVLSSPPMIVPFVEKTVHPLAHNTYGLSHCSYDVRIAQTITIYPGQFKLASTFERFHMPLDLMGQCLDKSSLVRRGLTVQNTQFDPGWRGYATLELCNHSPIRITLIEGEPVAQIIFQMLLEPTEFPYAGKYQDQESGPTPAREEAP